VRASRLLAVFLLAPLLALLAAPAAHARDWSVEDFVGRRSQWDGFEVGTQVHVRRTATVTRKGEEAPETTVQEYKRTLVAVRADEVEIEVAERVGDEWRTGRQTLPRIDLEAVETEAAGEGEIRVGDRTLACEKTRVRRPGPRGPEELVLWANEEYGILRIEMIAPTPKTVTATALVTTATIGTRNLLARRFALDVPGEGEARVRGTLELSLQVPEGMVRQELVGTRDGGTYRVESRVVGLSRVTLPR
jgi:hypothetical protein